MCSVLYFVPTCACDMELPPFQLSYNIYYRVIIFQSFSNLGYIPVFILSCIGTVMILRRKKHAFNKNILIGILLTCERHFRDRSLH